MMRRRAGIALVAVGALLAGLVAVPGAPAGAQDLADLPRLGFEIDPTEGNVGDVVAGQVDTDDIQEHCLDWVPSGETPAQALADDWIDNVVIPVMFGFPDPWPGPPGPGPFYFGEERLDDRLGDEIEDPLFQAFYRVYATFWTGLSTSSSIRDIFFSSMFPMTFVDPVTQELLGDIGGYDPFTGEGAVDVPDLDPGLYAVAAACTFPASAEDQVLGGGLDRSLAAFTEWAAENYPDNNFPEFCLVACDESVGDAWRDFVEAAAPVVLQELVDIQAIGLDFYCILQPDGHCATPPGPVGLIDDDVVDEFNGDEPGDDPPSPGTDDPGDTGDLVAVQATPSFTG